MGVCATVFGDGTLVSKVIGIVGGMGPAATVDLFSWVVAATPAQRDQDHLHVIVDNLPAILDRTAAIIGEGPSPLPLMLESARRLEAMGAQVLGIPCNAAYHWYEEMQAGVGVPVIHMIRETGRQLRASYSGAALVGLLATTGTVLSGIYVKELAPFGYKIIVPGPAGQEAMMEAIYGPDGIKAGKVGRRARRLLLEVADELAGAGAETLILGCTEIPLALRPKDLPLPAVNPNQVLAEALLRAAPK